MTRNDSYTRPNGAATRQSSFPKPRRHAFDVLAVRLSRVGARHLTSSRVFYRAARRARRPRDVAPATMMKKTTEETTATTRTRATYSNETKLRSEAEALLRIARQFLFGACGTSATIGSGIAVIQGGDGRGGRAERAAARDVSGKSRRGSRVRGFFRVVVFERREGARAADGENRAGGTFGTLAMRARERTRDAVGGFERVRAVRRRRWGRCVRANGVEDAERVREGLIERGVLIIPVSRVGRPRWNRRAPRILNLERRRFAREIGRIG